ncbi:MAG: BadF/BadG/BcrA/BcrD ATPase family protein [Pseudomonadota bacterium]
MIGSVSDRVLAIDGGGSGCRLALVGANARVEVTAGPANVSSHFSDAIAAIRSGLGALAAEAEVSEAALHGVPAYLGLAGVVGPKDAVRVAHALPLTSARIESDQPATVEGALGPSDGAVAGLGTGSFFGLRRGAVLRLAGGWGHRIDDRASGYWLGREALRLTLSVADGLEPAGSTSIAVTQAFPTPHDIVAFSKDASPDEVAALAPLVVAAEASGDPAAARILSAGTEYIVSTLSALGWRRDDPLCTIGGVAAAFAGRLSQTVDLVDPVGAPLDGAIARARRFAKGQLN